MKEWIRSYHMFIPKRPGIWRWTIYLIYPLLLSFIWIDSENASLGLLTAGLLALTFEIFVDGFTFSGIANKDGLPMDYVLASKKGTKIIRYGVIMDSIRRFASLFIIHVVMYLRTLNAPFDYQEMTTPAYALGMLLMAYVVCTISNMITRRFTGWVINIFMAYVMGFVYVLGVILVDASGATWGVIILIAIITLLLTMLQIKMVMSQVQKYYYDEVKGKK